MHDCASTQAAARTRPRCEAVRTCVAIFAFLIGLTATAFALDHTGTCTGTFLAADNPHRLTGGCTATAGQTLTLEAGVILNGQGFALNVAGNLVAAGTAMQPITLDSVTVNFQSGSGGQITNDTVSGGTAVGFTNIIISDASPTISGNTVSNGAPNSGRLILVAGSSTLNPAAPTITGNQLQVPLGGMGIVYNSGTERGTLQGNTFTFPATGFGNRFAIQVNGTASPRIEANTLTDDPMHTDTGIALLVSEASAVQVLNNSICSTGGDTPLSFTIGFFSASLAQISGTTLPCGSAGGFGLSGSTTTAADYTLAGVNGVTAFRMTDFVTVGAGARLIVPAGFSITNSLGFGIVVNGTLLATGASFTNSPITLNASGGSMLTNNIITTTFNNGTLLTITGSAPTITGNSFSTAPTTFNSTAAVAVTNAAPVLNGNTFSGMGFAVIVSGTSTLTIDNNTFTTDTVALRITDPASRVTMTNNTFDRNTSLVTFPTFNTLFSAFPMMLETNAFLGRNRSEYDPVSERHGRCVRYVAGRARGVHHQLAHDSRHHHVGAVAGCGH